MEGERVADGPIVARKRSNVRGAKGPCCLQFSDSQGGEDEMIKASIGLQDLRRRIYVKAKADTFCGFPTRRLQGFRWKRWSRYGLSETHGCFAAIGLSTLCRKSLRQDRSHKLWGEANKKAQCGKSARWV